MMKMMNTSFSLMTVNDLVDEISCGKFLIPEFVDGYSHYLYYCDVKEIEKLFENIFAGQPFGNNTRLNSGETAGNLVLWNLAKPVPNIVFYGFVRHFSEVDIRDPYRKIAPKCFEMGTVPFRAVLGNAVLLESLYLGLRGTITSSSVERKNCYVKKDFPPQTLYLNLYHPDETRHGETVRFRFLTDEECERESQNGSIWVKAGRILDEDIASIIDSVTLPSNALQKAEEILIRLDDRINTQEIIYCCSIDEGSFDDAFEMFFSITPNCVDRKAGTLFYILAAHWKQYDAKDEFERLKKFIGLPDPNFKNVNYILNTCMVLTCDEFDLTVQNLRKHVHEIEDNWIRIERSLSHVYGLFKKIWGKDHPYVESDIENILVYWFFRKGIRYENHHDDLTAVKRWMALWKLHDKNRFFSPNATRMIKAFIDETESDLFPFDAIKHFMIERNIWKPLTDEEIETVISSRADHPQSEYLLPLLCQDEIAEESGITKITHLHPMSFFEDRKALSEVFWGTEDYLVATNWKIWNSVLNLCVVSLEKAYMKERMSLSEWAEKTGTPNSVLCVDDDISLDIKDFRAFIETRKKNIKAVLHGLLN